VPRPLSQPPPAFGRVLAAESVSNFGSMLSRLAIPWLAVLVLNATTMQIAALHIAETLAVALGSLWLGGVVDRRGKRAVMLACDGLRALVFALLVLAALWGAVTMTLLLVAGALAAAATAAFEMARSAWIAQRIDAAELPRRNAQLSMAGSVSETAAFALGGWVYQGLGAVVALVVDALSFVLSAWCLRGVPEVAASKRPATAQTHALRQLLAEAGDGLRAVWGRVRLRALSAIEALLAFSMGLTGTSVMIYTARDIALPPGVLGMVFALGALGAIGGAWLAPRVGRALGPGRAMTLGLIAFTLGAACVPLASGPGMAAVLLLAAQQIVGDGGHTLHDVHDRTLRQTAVPADLLGRADAGIRTVGAWASLGGTLAGGLLGEAFDARTVLWCAVAAGAAAALVAALTLGRHAPPSVADETTD